MSQGRFEMNLSARHRRGTYWRKAFLAATLVGIIALGAMLFNIANSAVGLVAVRNTTEPSSLSDRPLESLPKEELIAILQAHVSQAVLSRLEREQPLAERGQSQLYALVVERVVEPEILKTWSLTASLLQRRAIEDQVAREFAGARLEFRSWLSTDFLTRPMSSKPAWAGVRTAILGSVWMVLLTLAMAFPVGVAAAIYLEEYAREGWLSRLIEANIDNLAGVPSIIYGMLGLAVFVRALGAITSGAVFGLESTNGRTILSASMTMALLVLPLIITNAREAIRAVPRSLREAAFGLGATRWQTVWHHVLPSALPGILTGSILALSRALGETAPLIVVGASAYIPSDPTGPFSKFTALPVQIYAWTARPQQEFRHLAAAAIVVLLVTLLALNAAAILLRNRYSQRIG